MSDDDIGYGKPPKRHQFKPGQSGNPKGRPKGKKAESIDLRAILMESVIVADGRKIPFPKILLQRQKSAALKGDPAAVRTMFAMLQSTGAIDLNEQWLPPFDVNAVRAELDRKIQRIADTNKQNSAKTQDPADDER